MADRPDQPDDHIDLNLEDLDVEPLPAAPPPAAPGGVLVITGDDLAEVPAPAAPAYPAAGPGYPAAPGGLTAFEKTGKEGLTGFVNSLLLHMAIAGALGGFIAWLINEPRTLARQHGGVDSASDVYLSTMLFAAVVGGALGLLLGAVEGINARNWRRALLGGGLALVIGFVGGGLAGVFAQAVYGALRGGGNDLTMTQLMARAIGWCIAGLFVGLAVSVATLSPKKIVNGLCGGAVGGFAGGMLFDPIGAVMALMGDQGTTSRLIAQVVIGLATGVAIGLIEELRKQSWVVVVGGPLTGKQFILYRPVTTIGSSPKCDIALFKDQTIAPQHCVLEAVGGSVQVRDLGGTTGTYVNGRPVQRQALRRGDVIQLGGTALEYQDRALTPKPTGVPGPWQG